MLQYTTVVKMVGDPPSTETFDREVNKRLDDRWELKGELQMSSSKWGTWVSQALVRERAED